jgi:hypothetical protein
MEYSGENARLEPGDQKQSNMMRLLVAGGLELVLGHLRTIDRTAGKN